MEYIMDIYSFVNSKDIREHLQKIEYEFNSLETAWLIYMCRAFSYEQKKAAWTELINTMPDCKVPKRLNCIGWNSLHEMLKLYMDSVDRIVSDFNEKNDVLHFSFEGLWFDFPTPFKKGDIVRIPSSKGYHGGFVLEELSTWNPSEYLVKNGDYTDMSSRGYCVNPNGEVYYDSVINYMDLEYYNGPYKLNEKILPALSKFVKGEIELDLLLFAYRKVLLDVAIDGSMLKNWYTKEILEELGIK